MKEIVVQEQERRTTWFLFMDTPKPRNNDETLLGVKKKYSKPFTVDVVKFL